MTEFPCRGTRLDAAALSLVNSERGRRNLPPLNTLELLADADADLYRATARLVLTAYYDG